MSNYCKNKEIRIIYRAGCIELFNGTGSWLRGIADPISAELEAALIIFTPLTLLYIDSNFLRDFTKRTGYA